MTYRSDIDGLRALAVMLVLVFHFDLFSMGKAGFIGVDIFFVISGFLITSIIRRDLEVGRFSVGSFLYRRIRRLYPALLVTLIITLLAGWVLLLPYRLEELAKETILSLLYVINFYFWRSINYFGLQSGSVPLLHMWSLAIEEQFYLVFPIVCATIWRLKPRLLTPAVFAGTVISFILALLIAPSRPEMAFYLLPTRAWELLLGSCLSLLVYGRRVEGRWLQFMGPIGLALVVISVVSYGPLTQVPGFYSLLPTMGATALLVGGYATTAPVTRLMSSAPLVWVGRISYPLYLVHWPIIIFMKESIYEFSIAYRIMGFSLSLILASLIFYIVERPIRDGTIFKSAQRYLSATAGLSLAIIVGAVVFAVDNGVPSRFSPEVQKYLSARDDMPKKFEGCERQFSSVDRLCRLGQRNEPPEIIVIGDSHAHALAGAFDLWLAKKGGSGALAYHSGCMPVLGAGRTDCERLVEHSLTAVRDARSVKEVILVSIWRQGLPSTGQPFLGRWVPADEVPKVFEEQLRKTVAMLLSAGKKVTIVDPLFSVSRSVPDTLAGNAAFHRHWPVEVSLVEHRKTFSPITAAFDRLSGVDRISLLGPICDARVCRAIVGGRPLFTDNNHLAQVHSELFASTIAAQVDQARGGKPLRAEPLPPIILR